MINGCEALKADHNFIYLQSFRRPWRWFLAEKISHSLIKLCLLFNFVNLLSNQFLCFCFDCYAWDGSEQIKQFSNPVSNIFSRSRDFIVLARARRRCHFPRKFALRVWRLKKFQSAKSKAGRTVWKRLRIRRLKKFDDHALKEFEGDNEFQRRLHFR